MSIADDAGLDADSIWATVLGSIGTALLLLLIPYLAAALALRVRNLDDRGRAACIIALSTVCFAVPIVFVTLQPQAPIWLKVVVTLMCPLPAGKLFDSHMGVATWRQMTATQWLTHLINMYVLCYRCHLLERPRPSSDRIGPLTRGLAEMAAGAGLLHWAFHSDLPQYGFWVEHSIKLIAAYLLVFDGMFVTATGALRLAGCNVMDQSRHPIAASTPADFWRRYNRDPGRFFHENVFKPAGGLRHPVRGILLVFLINGLLHEYLATVLIGRVTGHMLAFFGLQAVAVALTYRLRPRGAWRVISTACTIMFTIATAALFFAAVNRIIPWYSNGGVVW